MAHTNIKHWNTVHYNCDQQGCQGNGRGRHKGDGTPKTGNTPDALPLTPHSPAHANGRKKGDEPEVKWF